jgi:hypothetical protein
VKRAPRQPRGFEPFVSGGVAVDELPDAGVGRIPVCRGEFGLKIRYHVPRVHAAPGPKIVEIEEGEEALFPSATEWVVVQRGPDDERQGLPRWRPPRGSVEARFIPEPHVRQGITADVVICPRRRQYGAGKNWPHWGRLAALPGTFAAGAPDSSFNLRCPRAWDAPRFLDASIEAMRSARLVVATDAGLAHLAVLCGVPLLIITADGRVAPGPVINEKGKVTERRYWEVRWEAYYHSANHMGSPIYHCPEWHRPAKVVAEVERILSC